MMSHTKTNDSWKPILFLDWCKEMTELPRIGGEMEFGEKSFNCIHGAINPFPETEQSRKES